ncbi:MAG: DUF6048 family protein [Flavobacterium sp.]
MKHILKFSFSVLLFLSQCIGMAQENVTDTISDAKDTYGLRIGVDLYRTTRAFYDDNYKGLELVGDFRITKKIYFAAELGNENKTVVDDRLDFTSRGSYLKIGADYNFYQNWLEMDNQIYIGMRYAFSTFSQELNAFKIYTPHPFYGESQWIPSGDKFNGLTAQWIEIVVGFKAELLNNLYGGISLRLNRMISQNQPASFENLFVPGFNRTYSGTIGTGFNYTLTYSVPIYKKKKITTIP